VAFMKTPGFELVLGQCASEIKNIRPIAAVAVSKIFNAAMNPNLATEVRRLLLPIIFYCYCFVIYLCFQ
jgi:hypothetical protein